MVQLFYYENRGQCARKILRHEGCQTKVLLFPYEGWAQPASLTYWIIKTKWWSRTRCKVVEVSGTKKISTTGKLSTASNGCINVVGKFSTNTSSSSSSSSSPTVQSPSNATPRGGGSSVPSTTPSVPCDTTDFKLTLSTNVSNTDFQMGYSMTGTLERGNRSEGRMDMTHYAMIKRKGY